MVVLNDKYLVKYRANNDLMVWKKLVLGRNLQVALAELSSIGADEVLFIYPHQDL